MGMTVGAKTEAAGRGSGKGAKGTGSMHDGATGNDGGADKRNKAVRHIMLIFVLSSTMHNTGVSNRIMPMLENLLILSVKRSNPEKL